MSAPGRGGRGRRHNKKVNGSDVQAVGDAHDSMWIQYEKI